MNELAFTVHGTPAQMGSKKAFVVKGRAIITDDNRPTRRAWASAVSSAAAEAMAGRDLFRGPVELSIVFRFKRPQSHFGSGKNAGRLKESAPREHGQSPDLDKLIRCLNDALTGTVLADDKLICRLASRREWTSAQEGADVTVRAIGTQ